MRTIRFAVLSAVALLSIIMPVLAQAQAMQFVPLAPCRVLDTRQSQNPIQGGTFQTFDLASLAQTAHCPQSLSPGAAFSLNVTVVPHGFLGYLTIWPAGQQQPTISLMNSHDGRIKANATIVVGGGSDHTGVSIFVTQTADVILDVNGYFEPANSGAYAYYALPTPCRLADTRNGQPLPGGQEADFPVLGHICGIPGNAQAYSLNFTAIPNPLGHRLGYLTVWPAGGPRPTVSTLNDPTGTIVANAALLPANGTNGEIAVYPSDTTDLVIDIDGYFAQATPGDGLAFNSLTPCRAVDTRGTIGAFIGQQTFNIEGSACQPPSSAAGYVMNATALPQARLGFLTLWPDGLPLPLASTLNAIDGAFTSNMAIVGTTNGSIDAYASGSTNLLLDLSGYMAPLGPLSVTTTQLPQGVTGQSYSAQLQATGGEPPYAWAITSGTLPPGLTMTSAGVLSGIPTTAGSYPITVQASDQFNQTASANLSITVIQGTLIITTQSLPNGTQGVVYNATLGAAGGTPPYTWSIVSGTLPAGLNLNTSSGLIFGTPTTPGTSSFGVKVTDSVGGFANANLQIVIDAAPNLGGLNGHYAFSLSGYSNGVPFFMAGAFVADGNGNLQTGLLDINSLAGGPPAGYPFSGTYTVQADGLGTMQFNVASLGQMNFSISLSNVGNGQLIMNNADPQTRGSGVFLVQSINAFHPPAVGNYIIGSNGTDGSMKRYAKAGEFNVSSPGNVQSGEEDVNDNGTLLNRTYAGSFGAVAQLGRGLASFSYPGGITNHYAYYVVSNGQFIIIGTDPLNAQDPWTLGTIQTQLAANFTDASLSGNTILEMNGLNPNGGSPVADVVLGLANWNGGGGGNTSLDENKGGTMTRQTLQGNYNVESSGRVTTTGLGASSPILYLFNFDQGFAVGQDSSVLSGVVEQQTSNPPLGQQSINGIYVGGTLTPVEPAITDAVSFFQADGNGNLNGIQFYSAPSGPGQQNLTSTYTVDASGRAVVNPTVGNLGGIMYVVSAKKVVLLPSGNAPVLGTFSSAQTQ
jgi:hypothetical protein